MFKAKIAARDRHRVKAKFQPPTADAVRNTVLKLTAMAEKKSRDVDHLAERMRRVKLASSNSPTGSAANRSRTSLAGTPSRFATPDREVESSRRSGGYGQMLTTPVLALVEEGDLQEVAEENRRRKETGKKLRGALLRMKRDA